MTVIQSMTQGSGKAVLSCCVSINVLCILCDLLKSDNKRHLFAQTFSGCASQRSLYISSLFI